MINMIVWCYINVTADCNKNVCNRVETAVLGTVVDKYEDNLLVDFSEYASKQGYKGLSLPMLVNKDLCMERP